MSSPPTPFGRFGKLPKELRLEVYDHMASDGPAIFINDVSIHPLGFLRTSADLELEYHLHAMKYFPRHYTATVRCIFRDDDQWFSFTNPAPDRKRLVLHIDFELDTGDTADPMTARINYPLQLDYLCEGLRNLGNVEHLVIQMRMKNGYETTLTKMVLQNRIARKFALLTVPHLPALKEYILIGDGDVPPEPTDYITHQKRCADNSWEEFPGEMEEFLVSLGLEDKRITL